VASGEQEDLGASRAELAQHHGHGTPQYRRPPYLMALRAHLRVAVTLPACLSVSAPFIAPCLAPDPFHTVAPPWWE
jgi:hypothetical protein